MDYDHNDTRYMGEWDEWKHLYDQLPVVTRQALAHLHGRHDGPVQILHCPLCEDPDKETAETDPTSQITRAIDRNTRALLRIADMMADHVYRGGADMWEAKRGMAHRGVTAELKRLEEDR